MSTPSIDTEKLKRIAFILKSVAHPDRLAVVQLLYNTESLSVGEICTILNREQSLISHHLSNMRLKGILASERHGKKVFYSLKERSIVHIISCLENCNCNMGSIRSRP